MHRGALVWLALALYLSLAQMPLKLETDLGEPRICPLPVSPHCLTFTCPALIELKGEDDVALILAELADEAFGLAQLEGEKVRREKKKSAKCSLSSWQTGQEVEQSRTAGCGETVLPQHGESTC